MTLGTSVRSQVRRVLTTYGSDATLYPIASATVTNDDEGDETVSSWGSGSTIKVVPSNHVAAKAIFAKQFEEKTGEVNFIVRDDVTALQKDKITYLSVNYRVDDVSPLTLQSTICAYRVKVHRVD